MGDGAHLGVKPERALGTILGGDDQPTEDEQMTKEQMLEWVLDAPDEARSYDDGCRKTAKQMLAYMDDHPEVKFMPLESQREWPDGYSGKSVVVRKGAWDVMKEDGVEFESGLTGFMVGYAFNLARSLCDMPPGPNPAIL